MCLSQNPQKHETSISSRTDRSIKELEGHSANHGHTLLHEEGEASVLDLSDLEYAMTLDADAQYDTLNLLCERLDEIVRINDQRKVLNGTCTFRKLRPIESILIKNIM
jgi:hypothetical protein